MKRHVLSLLKVACIVVSLCILCSCAGTKSKEYQYVGYGKESIRTAFGDPTKKIAFRKNEEIWEYVRNACKITFTFVNNKVESCHTSGDKCDDML